MAQDKRTYSVLVDHIVQDYGEQVTQSVTQGKPRYRGTDFVEAVRIYSEAAMAAHRTWSVQRDANAFHNVGALVYDEIYIETDEKLAAIEGFEANREIAYCNTLPYQVGVIAQAAHRGLMAYLTGKSPRVKTIKMLIEEVAASEGFGTHPEQLYKKWEQEEGVWPKGERPVDAQWIFEELKNRSASKQIEAAATLAELDEAQVEAIKRMAKELDFVIPGSFAERIELFYKAFEEVYEREREALKGEKRDIIGVNFADIRDGMLPQEVPVRMPPRSAIGSES